MKYLVDANIPKGIKEFETQNFFQIYTWGDGITDTEIWEYAIENELIIISRDADFYFRLLTSTIFPKVIFLKLQQVNKESFKIFIHENWKIIEKLISINDMLIVELESIQTIKK